MEIIALAGLADTGKTTSLNLFDDVLVKQKGYKSILHKGRIVPLPSGGNLKIGSDLRDFIDYYTKECEENIIVGLMTEGDCYWKVEQALEYFSSKKCDYVILASHIGGKFPKELSKTNGYFTHIHKEVNDPSDNNKVVQILSKLIP